MVSERDIPAVKLQKTVPGEPLHVKYLGTNCILIGDGKTQWMVDPHFTRPCKSDLLKRLAPDPARIEAGLADARIENLQAVVLSHTHYDHALDAVGTCRLSGATLVGSQSAHFLGMGANLPSSQMRVVQGGDSLSLGNFRVSFFVSRHILLSRFFNAVSGMHRHIDHPISPSAYFWQYREGTVFTLFIQHPHKCFLISSSAGFFVQKPTALKVDFSILSIGGLMLKSNAYLRCYMQQMALDVDARRVFLSHWDDFTTPLCNPLRWMPGSQRIVKRCMRQARSNDIAVEVLPYGEEIRV